MHSHVPPSQPHESFECFRELHRQCSRLLPPSDGPAVFHCSLDFSSVSSQMLLFRFILSGFLKIPTLSCKHILLTYFSISFVLFAFLK